MNVPPTATTDHDAFPPNDENAKQASIRVCVRLNFARSYVKLTLQTCVLEEEGGCFSTGNASPGWSHSI